SVHSVRRQMISPWSIILWSAGVGALWQRSQASAPAMKGVSRGPWPGAAAPAGPSWARTLAVSVADTAQATAPTPARPAIRIRHRDDVAGMVVGPRTRANSIVGRPLPAPRFQIQK